VSEELAPEERLREFVAQHREPGCFLLANAWDAGSARMLESCGFDALATTSAGIAFSLGRPDHGFTAADDRVDRETMLKRVATIAAAVSVPVSADLEDGYGEGPEAVAETISLAIEAGAAGGNIEDFSGRRDEPLYERGLATERVRAAREAIDRSGSPFALVARTDSFLIDHERPLEEAIDRGNAFYAAGADCIFVPGASDATTIGKLVAEIEAPINVVVGLTGGALSLSELRLLGVRRVTIGGSLARVLYAQIRRAADEMLSRGSFAFGGDQIPQSELNEIFSQTGKEI
jgi:2-methylisocitrate lyase-like PEP mutase family enzyme